MTSTSISILADKRAAAFRSLVIDASDVGVLPLVLPRRGEGSLLESIAEAKTAAADVAMAWFKLFSGSKKSDSKELVALDPQGIMTPPVKIPLVGSEVLTSTTPAGANDGVDRITSIAAIVRDATSSSCDSTAAVVAGIVDVAIGGLFCFSVSPKLETAGEETTTGTSWCCDPAAGPFTTTAPSVKNRSMANPRFSVGTSSAGILFELLGGFGNSLFSLLSSSSSSS
mmetsp:Transcript_27510/g.36533  ORF Transcript_27510/g.36533 Transcript_27510/m.36533 type:complete len:227 (+) Transcript_27510:2741-3421(+)